jgi:hypothetical protein
MGKSILLPPLCPCLSWYETTKYPFTQVVTLYVQEAPCAHLLPLAYIFIFECVLLDTLWLSVAKLLAF